MPIPMPQNEEARLEVLQQLNLIESLGDEAYDFVTKVAAKVMDVPMALITLIDHDYQYFLSKVGSENSGTSRESSFCAYNIVDSEMLIVEDATKDDRFKDNPFVIDDPKIRFYAGAPIEAEENVFLGSVCVLDTKPRQLSEEQLDMLEALGRQVSYLVKIRKLVLDLGLKAQELELLKQMVPKCSRCGNIRTEDKDYWTTVDDYLSLHAGVELTASFCPDCQSDLDENLELV